MLSYVDSPAAWLLFLHIEVQDLGEDRINIYDDDPAKRNLPPASSASKANVKDSSAYHCVGPSSSREAMIDKRAGGAKKQHHYQDVHSLRLGDRYEVHHPEPVGETEIKIATAYETPIMRKDRVRIKEM